MDELLLKSAQQGLRMSDVALRASRVVLADKFEPKYEKLPGNIQVLQQVTRTEVVALKNEGDERELFRVRVKLGIRWVRDSKSRGQANADGEQGQKEPEVVANIEATFLAEYEMVKPVDPSALEEFAMHNAPWHIWPFWREYVANQCARLNIPKATMPMQCLQPLKESDTDHPTP